MPRTVALQIEAVRAELESRPPALVRHIERVVAEAAALAAFWDVDPERCALAAWGHDLFRAHSPTEQLKLAREVGVPASEADEASPVLLHGPIAAVVLRQRFAVTDEDALAAVRDHTVGAAEMPIISRIILLADKFEPRKRARTPLMKEIRKLARRDIDLALLCWADWKWVEEAEHGWRSHPRHWEARRVWVKEHHAMLLPSATASEAATSDEGTAESAGESR